MGGLYGGADEGQAKSGFSCGHTLPGATVGQPHLQSVQCRNRVFELVLGQRQPNNRTPVVSHCISCHAQDSMLLLLTNADTGEGGGILTAAYVPALLQQNANPGLIVCPACQQFRFELLDDGNEIKRRCAYCKDTQHLGYDTKAGQGSQARSFGTS